MESARSKDLRTLRRALADPAAWLGGPGAEGFAAACLKVSRRLEQYQTARGRGPLIVANVNPAAYLAGVLSAIEQQHPLVLANPRWGEVERAQAAMQIKPGLWLGEKENRWPGCQPEIDFDSASWPGAILIPTGGTGGRVRWAVHQWATLAVAARALTEFLNADGCTHVSTLPPCHVSGLMPAVRAIETGGRLWLEDWKTLETGSPPGTVPEDAIISLVPTQLQRLMKHREVLEWLSHTRAILLGGAAATPELLKWARQQRLPIALAYGLTETAAVVAAQKPKDFLAGRAPNFTPLPHAKIKIGEDGRMLMQASSLFYGYYPCRRKRGPFATGDFGRLDTQGCVQVRGRLDQIIVTGGEKVDPAEVEKYIRASGLVKDVRVIGLPDAEWGERVVAVYSGQVRPKNELGAALKGKLAAWAVPRLWIHTCQDTIPKRPKII